MANTKFIPESEKEKIMNEFYRKWLRKIILTLMLLTELQYSFKAKLNN